MNFDDATAVEADIMITQTVSYTVTMTEYAGIANQLTDSFDFTILCPDLLTTSSLVTPVQNELFYDFVADATVSTPIPDISLSPETCFNIA